MEFTEKEYRDAVCRKLIEGKSCILNKRTLQENVYSKKVKMCRYKVVRLYKHFVHFLDEKGYNICYRYSEIYKALREGEDI